MMPIPAKVATIPSHGCHPDSSEQTEGRPIAGWQPWPGMPLLSYFLFRYTLEKWQLCPGMVATIRRNPQLARALVCTVRDNQISQIELAVGVISANISLKSSFPSDINADEATI